MSAANAPTTGGRPAEKGAALVMAMFVLVLLTGLGIALLFLSQTEAKMSQASLRSKSAFYAAEAGLEDARMALYAANGEDPLDDDLADVAGDNGSIDFRVDDLTLTYDQDGNVTGLAGFQDDDPLLDFSDFGDTGGWYAAFLTNDPLEGTSAVADPNQRVMITAVGGGDRRSAEVVQAIIEPYRFVPPVPPAAITLLGPDPEFDNGTSNAQSHTGNDCGVSGGPYAPIVGTVGDGANDYVQDNLNRPDTFQSGPYTGTDTIGDLTDPDDPIVDDAGHGTIDTFWLDCEGLKQLVETLSSAADYYCNSDIQSCTIPATTPSSVTVIDGDLSGTPPGMHYGTLLVTGELTYHGNTGWDGVILVIGEGAIVRSGGGSFEPSGSMIIANIDPSPDGPVVNKSDWCETEPDGFDSITYQTSGAGDASVEWCTGVIGATNSVRSYSVVQFAQH